MTMNPLVHSHAATHLEAEMKDLFIKLYEDFLKDTADDINVYGAPHLGSFSLIERNVDMDGLTALRETTEERIRYLFTAWRHSNPQRGMHFLRTYLACIFGNNAEAAQLWQKTTEAYPTAVKTELEISNDGESLSDYYLTSRVRVDIGSDLLPDQLARSMRSAVAARILLNLRILKRMESSVGMASVLTAVMVGRLSNVTSNEVQGGLGLLLGMRLGGGS